MFADLTPLRLAWLTLALIGAGVSLGLGPAAIHAPRPDHWVAALTLVLWCGVETTVRRNWPALLALPALALGVGCALPFYLFLRSARIA
ncbi:DUF2834 domain-containing protein [Paracoccus aeridis]|uniref:DUF2834 domain-containing protein n=1 Tax=Paracoccus aeridis TaxID=1966466 RepID=UPI001F3E9CE3|nr:DUF2834 domain-containing protein [Paracoccus aeridis]